MTDTTNDFDFESFKQAAIKGLYEGKRQRPTVPDGRKRPVRPATADRLYSNISWNQPWKGKWMDTWAKPATLSKIGVMARPSKAVPDCLT